MRLYQVDTNCSRYSSFGVPNISLTRDITWIIFNWFIDLIVASFDRSAGTFMTDSTEMSVTKLFESSSPFFCSHHRHHTYQQSFALFHIFISNKIINNKNENNENNQMK